MKNIEKNADESQKLEKLCEDGFLVMRIFKLSEQSDNNLKKMHRFFHINLEVDDLLNLKNRDKRIIILRHLSTGDQIELLTSDQRVIDRAITQLQYQYEPVGTSIRANCIVGSPIPTMYQIAHLDNLIRSLDGLWGWEFKFKEEEEQVRLFVACIKLDSVDERVIENAIKRFEQLMDYLSVKFRIGFQIQGITRSPIPRADVPYFCDSGPEEYMIPSLTHEELAKTESIISSSEVMRVAKGLNQAYAATNLTSCHNRLWAAVEDIFNITADRMFNDEEVDALIECVKKFDYFKNDNNNKKIDSLKSRLSDPKQFARRGRNERIADNLALTMGIDNEKAITKIKEASALRGKHGHTLDEENKRKLKESAKFLEDVLLGWFDQEMKNKFNK